MKRLLSEAIGFIERRYFTVDARTLALFRVVFGLHLIANLYDRTAGPDAVAFFTNSGVLPNHYALYSPLGERIWSLLFPFSTSAEVQVAFLAILAVYIAYVVGFCTKVAQVLAVACLVSLANRNLMLQNGGVVVTHVVAVWTAFLPLGRRFSIDALRRRHRDALSVGAVGTADLPADPRENDVVRVAFFGILANFACIYFFNYAHKRGTTWHDGSAVHWVLWQNRINTIWAAWLRMHEPSWLSPLLTRGTLIIEEAIPVLLLSPVATKWTRRAAVLAIFSLHCGISLMMTLGPFSYSMMSFSLLLIGKDDWEIAKRLLAAHEHKLAPIYRLYTRAKRWLSGLVVRWEGAAPLLRSGSAARRLADQVVRFAGEGLALGLCTVVTIQILTDNWAIDERYRVKNRPEIVREVVDYLRIPQGWSMFSPDAPRDDGTLVIDATLSDGTHLDPRKQRPPDFEPGLHGPWFDDQSWCDWDLRMKFDGNRHFYPNFRDYIARLDRFSSWKQNASIRSFEVYWVNNAAPPPGSTTPYDTRRQLLFTNASTGK